MRLLLVNTVANGGSIPEYIHAIADAAIARGHTVAVAKGRRNNMPGVRNIQIGSIFDTLIHGLSSRLFDRHGLESRRATRRFIHEMENYAPDVIHLHNIHGYYLNYPMLFEWLGSYSKPVLWSLHDCWAFTGHCSSYTADSTTCLKWQTRCGHCPMLERYPASLLDRSHHNFETKKNAFNSISNLHLLPVSDWLNSEIGMSSIASIRRTTVKIDTDTGIFQPSADHLPNRVLGVANEWTATKGLDYFSHLRSALPQNIEIRLIGRIRTRLPKGITAAGWIKSRKALAEEYSRATVFVNPTMADTYSMTNREAISCGTPVITRIAGGSLEDLEDSEAVTGVHSVEEMTSAIIRIMDTFDTDRTVYNRICASARNLASHLYAGRPHMQHLMSILESANPTST